MSSSITDISNWAASTNYQKYDIVTINSLYYYSSFSHLSGSDFNTDLNAGNWFGYINDNNEQKPYFNFKSSYRPNITNNPKIKKISFEGYTQRLQDGLSNNLPTINLAFENIDTSEATAILHFLETRNSSESFLFIPPAPIGRLTRWVCEKWEWTQNYFNNYTVTAEFQRTTT